VRADLEDIATRLGRLPGLRDFGITSNGIVLAKKLPGAPPSRVRLHAAHADASSALLQRCATLV
jgi:hypothetical protein